MKFALILRPISINVLIKSATRSASRYNDRSISGNRWPSSVVGANGKARARPPEERFVSSKETTRFPPSRRARRGEASVSKNNILVGYEA